VLGLGFIFLQNVQSVKIAGINAQLAVANAFLASVSERVSKYISPQIYRSIFSGDTDASISTRRKKLSIFFSDIKDFTSTSERLQPEELTALLNEYFTEMSAIALRHGGTVDKFVGDAILVFFGDPETRGVAEDARCALRMAVDMQRRLALLNAEWRARGRSLAVRVRQPLERDRRQEHGHRHRRAEHGRRGRHLAHVDQHARAEAETLEGRLIAAQRHLILCRAIDIVEHGPRQATACACWRWNRVTR